MVGGREKAVSKAEDRLGKGMKRSQRRRRRALTGLEDRQD
jgi:hypothetical protein